MACTASNLASEVGLMVCEDQQIRYRQKAYWTEQGWHTPRECLHVYWRGGGRLGTLPWCSMLDEEGPKGKNEG